jgi:hypothetical protein
MKLINVLIFLNIPWPAFRRDTKSDKAVVKRGLVDRVCENQARHCHAKKQVQVAASNPR